MWGVGGLVHTSASDEMKADREVRFLVNKVCVARRTCMCIRA